MFGTTVVITAVLCGAIVNSIVKTGGITTLWRSILGRRQIASARPTLRTATTATATTTTAATTATTATAPATTTTAVTTAIIASIGAATAAKVLAWAVIALAWRIVASGIVLRRKILRSGGVRIWLTLVLAFMRLV